MNDDFIELHCIEFGSDDSTATPVTYRKSEITSFQPFTNRMRQNLMDQQTANNEKRAQEGYQPLPIKEMPANCASVMLKRVMPGHQVHALTLHVEESYDEIKYILGLVEKDK